MITGFIAYKLADFDISNRQKFQTIKIRSRKLNLGDDDKLVIKVENTLGVILHYTSGSSKIQTKYIVTTSRRISKRVIGLV